MMTETRTISYYLLPFIVIFAVVGIIGNAYFRQSLKNNEQVAEAVGSLYQYEVPGALESYRVYQGRYPDRLSGITLDKLQPKQPYTQYFTDYTQRLEERKIEDPLIYQALDAGQDYRLCLKASPEQCKGPTDLFADREYVPGQKDYQPSGDYYRDQVRETTRFLLQAYLYRYNKDRGVFPDNLNQLVAAYPSALRSEHIVDIQTKQPHSYMVASDKKDYELCLSYENISLGCQTNSDYIRYARPE